MKSEAKKKPRNRVNMLELPISTSNRLSNTDIYLTVEWCLNSDIPSAA